jgi:hypothetical protein
LNVEVFFVRFLRARFFNRLIRIDFRAAGVGASGRVAFAWSSAKMDPQTRDPWRTKYKASAWAAAIFSQWMCAIAGVKSTVRSEPVGRPARRRVSAAGSANRRTKITSAARSTWSGCGHGGPPIRGIGAPIGVPEALRYKTPLRAKSLKHRKIWSAVRYKTRFDAKVLY